MLPENIFIQQNNNDISGGDICRKSGGAYLFAVFSLIIISGSGNIFSQTDLPDSVVTEQIRVIGKMLEEGKPNANFWWYGWLAGYSAATVGQGAIALSTDNGTLKQDMVLGSATTLLGAIGQLITPMVPGFAPDRLKQIPEDTDEERLMKLQKAEELLKKSAMREKSGRSWQAHVITGVVNLGSGLIAWLGFNRDIWAGVENFAINTAITETQIWTQPTKAMKDYKKYCSKYKSGINPIAFKQDIKLFVSGGPGGIQLKIIF
jgi:hypothetical protein